MAYNKVNGLMANVKWTEIYAALDSGDRVRLADYAEQYGVSVPTMRKMMERKFGTKIEFRRGRTGGVFTTSDWTLYGAPSWVKSSDMSSEKGIAAAVVNYVPDAPVSVDSETEAIVDSILGVDA